MDIAQSRKNVGGLAAASSARPASKRDGGRNAEIEKTAKALAVSAAGARTSSGGVQAKIERQPFGTFRIVSGAVTPSFRDGIETIGEREYHKLTETWRAVLDGSGNVLFDDKLTRNQRAALTQAFAQLLSRPTGRELVEYCVWAGPKHVIEAGEGYVQKPETGGPFRVGVHVYRDLGVTARSPNNEDIAIPLFVALGHELGHLYHHSIGTNLSYMPEPTEYENLEERQTILRWENGIRREHGLPARAGHFATYFSNVPLDAASRELLRKIALGSAVEEVESERGQTLIRNLVAIAHNNDPEISDLTRETCKNAAEHLLEILNFSVNRTYFAKAYVRELEAAYTGIARLFPTVAVAMPDFETLSREGFLAERRRLLGSRAALFRQPGREALDLLVTLDTLAQPFQNVMRVGNNGVDLAKLAREHSPEAMGLPSVQGHKTRL